MLFLQIVIQLIILKLKLQKQEEKRGIKEDEKATQSFKLTIVQYYINGAKHNYKRIKTTKQYKLANK